MDLFLDKHVPTFEKIAAEVELPEDPNQWPRELLQELHKQVSFISDFDPRIVMDRVDAEKGYGFGHFEVGNRMSDPDAPQATRDVTGAKSARIPIIISEGRLKPFDLVINDQSKIFPLTEPRLRQALFRPQMFDMEAKGPGDESIVGRLYPPMRQSNYVGGAMAVPGSGGMVVQGSAGMGKLGGRAERSGAVAVGMVGKHQQKMRSLRQAGDDEGAQAERMRHQTAMRTGKMCKTAEEQWNDFVTGGETREPGFTAWDGQHIETAGDAEQRQRVRTGGDLEAALGNDGVFGAVLSDQNRQAMGMPTRGPIAGTDGPQGYQRRRAALHHIAGGRMKQAAMRLRIPEPEEAIKGQKVEGHKPRYTGSMGPDGKIKKVASAMYWENNYEKDESSGNYVPKNYSGDVRHVTFQHKGSGESRTFLMPKAHFEQMQKDQGYKKMDRAKKAQLEDIDQETLARAIGMLRQPTMAKENIKERLRAKTAEMIVDVAIDKLATVLSAQMRGQIKAKNFAVRPRGGEPKYPLPDLEHARNALTRVRQYGTPGEKAQVYKAVTDRYPALATRSGVVPEKQQRKAEKKLDLAPGSESQKKEKPEQRIKAAAVEGTPEALKPFQVPVKRDKEERADDKKEDKAVGKGLDAIDEGTSEKERGRMLSKEDKEKAASVLSSILPTINESDFLSFAEACEPEEVKIAMLRNTPMLEAVGVLARWEPRADVDVGSMAKQSVAQAARLEDGTYRVKYASHLYWEPRTVIMDRGSLYDAIGDAVMQVDLHGSVTMVKGAQVGDDGPEQDHPEPIEDFGMWRVQTTDGKDVVGFAIPNLIDLDGTPLPLVLFTNGSASAVQGDMVGVRSGGEPNLPKGPEQGHGAFVRVRDNGKAEATVPIEIEASVTDENGGSWLAEDFQGRPVTIRKQPNIQMPMKVDDVVLLPESFRWMPLGGEGLELVDGVESFGKQAEAVRYMLSVEIRGGGGTFSIDGPPVEKLASAERHFVDLDAAAFLLGGLGVAPALAMRKLSEAKYLERPIRARVGRMIKTGSARRSAAVKTAASRRTNQLFPDPTAVDTVLSLGFINPENVTAFINALPRLEDGQSRMCAMLIGARLGLKEVPEGALEKAVQATEEVLDGLKVLAFQET